MSDTTFIELMRSKFKEGKISQFELEIAEEQYTEQFFPEMHQCNVDYQD